MYSATFKLITLDGDVHLKTNELPEAKTDQEAWVCAHEKARILVRGLLLDSYEILEVTHTITRKVLE